jgi:hypothetical protein
MASKILNAISASTGLATSQIARNTSNSFVRDLPSVYLFFLMSLSLNGNISGTSHPSDIAVAADPLSLTS